MVESDMSLCKPLAGLLASSHHLLRLIILVLVIPYAHAGVDLSKYSIVFEDNFDGDSLDTSKWSTAFLWGPYFPINSAEQQYIDKTGMHKSAAVSPFEFTGSTLKIVARKKSTADPLPARPAKTDPIWNEYPEYRYNENYQATNSKYTSGIITSYESFKFTHGYAETSAKLPEGAGLWSAFWLLNAFYVEDSPEMDIMEALGHKPGSVFQRYHFFDIKNDWRLISSPTHESTGADYSAGFHTFGVSWEPDRIIWYVDGVEVNRINASSQINGRVAAQAMYIIANLAVGGSFVGNVGRNATPASFDIDYIRVYQLQTAHQAGGTSDVVARAKNTRRELDANGVAGLLADSIDNGSSADSGIASLTVSPQQLTCDDTDDANVTLSVTSEMGYTERANATATAVDSIKPEVRTKDISASLEGENSVTLTVDDGSNDACGIANLSISPDTFDSAGTKTVTLSATDNNNNTATATAQVNAVEKNTAGTAPNDALPAIVSPADNTTISGSEVTFSWSARQVNVSEWWLFIGSTPRGRDLYSSGRLRKSTLSLSVNLDKTAALLHASLYYKVSGKWSLVESRYTHNTRDGSTGDPGGSSAPAILSPVPESTLSAESTNFTWTANGNNVSTWWLFTGTSAGARDVFNSGRLTGNTLSLRIPAEAVARTTHVSLYYKTDGKWQRQIFGYQRNSAYDTGSGNGDNDNNGDAGPASQNSSLPAIQTPLTSQALPPGSTTFSWSNNGFKVSEWWLYAGSSANAHDIHNSGRLPGSTRSATLDLQGESGKLYITLYYKTAGKWAQRPYVFNKRKTADASKTGKVRTSKGPGKKTGDNSGKPAMLNPLDGGLVTDNKVTLQWSANGADVAQWWLLLGKVAGGSELFDSGRLAASSTSLEVDMPGGNRGIFVTLLYKINEGWTSTRSRFTSD